MSSIILFAFATALLAGLTSAADKFYIYASAPGKEVDKWLVDTGSFQKGEFQRQYFFLTLDPKEASFGFHGGGQYGKYLFNPQADPLGIDGLLLTDENGMTAEWPNGIIETSYDFYACNSMDARVPTDQWIIYGKWKEGASLSGEASSVVPSETLGISGVSDDITTDVGSTGLIGGSSDVADSVRTGEPAQSNSVVTDVSVSVDTNTAAESNTDASTTGIEANSGVIDTMTEITSAVSERALFIRESPPAYGIYFDKCIPIVLHVLTNLTDLESSCTDPSCSSEESKCLTICKPCSASICAAVCSYITICEEPKSPSPDTPTPNPNSPSPHTPTPNPNTPSPKSPTPVSNSPSPSVEIIPGCPTCVQTVIDYVFTCPSSTTITISTCPNVNICSATVLLLPPGTHTITGRAVVPATSGSITVTGSASASSKPSATGSLTTFNGAARGSVLMGSILGLLMLCAMLF